MSLHNVESCLVEAPPIESLQRRKHATATASFALAALLAGSAVIAQNRSNDYPPAQQSPRCSLIPAPIVPRTPDSSPDPRSAPALLPMDGGTLALWRAERGGLWVAGFDTSWNLRGEEREFAQPATLFAATPAPGGAAVALVEHGSHGDALLLARLSATGEARNVPREITRTDSVDGIAIAWTGSGFVVAWGIGGSSGPATYALLTDARGVPRTSPHRVATASAPRLAHVPGADVTVLAATGGGNAVVASLDATGAVLGSSRWPATARGLVASPSGIVYALALPGEGQSALLPSLVRWIPGATTVETPVPLRVAPGSSVVALESDRNGMVAAIDEPSGREIIARIGFDGSAALLAVRPGTLGALLLPGDAMPIVVGHEPPPAGRGRFARIELACPRSMPPAVPSPSIGASPSTSTSPPASFPMSTDASADVAASRDAADEH